MNRKTLDAREQQIVDALDRLAVAMGYEPHRVARRDALEIIEALTTMIQDEQAGRR